MIPPYTIRLILALGLVTCTAIAETENFPFVEGLMDNIGKPQPWTLEQVRLNRDDVIGDLTGKTSTMEKDSAANPNFIHVSKIEEEKNYETDLDLTDITGQVFFVIQADDQATLTIKEKPTGKEATGHAFIEQTYQLLGTALWRVDRSYKEFPNPILGGRTYNLKLNYRNTANLTKKYNGTIDYDGVNVFLISGGIDLKIAKYGDESDLAEDQNAGGSSTPPPHEMNPGSVVFAPIKPANGELITHGKRAKLTITQEQSQSEDGTYTLSADPALAKMKIYETKEGGKPIKLPKEWSAKEFKTGDKVLYVGSDPFDINDEPVEGALTLVYNRNLSGDVGAKLELKDQVKVTIRPFEFLDSMNAKLDDGNDVQIEPKKIANDQRPQTVAWIDPHGTTDGKSPEMPWPVMRILGAEQLSLKIKWKLGVEYKRPNGRKLDEDKVLIPGSKNEWITENLDGVIEIYDHPKWISEIEQKGFFGGDAELSFQLLKSDESPLMPEKKLMFYIGGKNPDSIKCKSYITDTATAVQQPMAWFAYAIAKHESKDYNGKGSRYNQFWNGSGRFAKMNHHAGEVLWVDNPGEAPPKGFGLFQVTGNLTSNKADIPRKQLWNWQDNVRAGLAIVAGKRGIGDRYFARIQRKSEEHKAAFRQCPPHSIPIGSNIFSSLDAIQIYGYNGTGNKTIDSRYPFDPNKPCGLGATKRWFWNPHNVANGEPYINKVERELD